jgi:hypothetical protein
MAGAAVLPFFPSPIVMASGPRCWATPPVGSSCQAWSVLVLWFATKRKGGASGDPAAAQPSPGQQGLQRRISGGRWIEALLLESTSAARAAKRR